MAMASVSRGAQDDYAAPPSPPTRSATPRSLSRHSPRARTPSSRLDGPASKMNVVPAGEPLVATDSGYARDVKDEGHRDQAATRALGPPPRRDVQSAGARAPSVTGPVDDGVPQAANLEVQEKMAGMAKGSGEGASSDNRGLAASVQHSTPHPVLQPQAQAYPIKMSEYPPPVPPQSVRAMPRVSSGDSTPRSTSVAAPPEAGGASRPADRTESLRQTRDLPQMRRPGLSNSAPATRPASPAQSASAIQAQRQPPPGPPLSQPTSSRIVSAEAPATSAKAPKSSSSKRKDSQDARLPPAKNNLRAGDTVTDPNTPHIHGCPFCDKVYTGQHARSICRRHQMSKHGIELEVQVKKSRWDNNPNRPATEAEKHKRTLESKRRWAAKDRRRRRAEKRGEEFDEDEEGDGPYTDEEDEEDNRSHSMSQEPRTRGVSHMTEDSQPGHRPLHHVPTYREERESDRSDVEMREEDSASAANSEVRTGGKLRRNMPVSTERRDDRLEPPRGDSRHSGRRGERHRRGRSRDASTASADRVSMRSDMYYQPNGPPPQQYMQPPQGYPQAGPVRYAHPGMGADGGYMAVPATEHLNGQGERILVYATAVQHPDGSVTYHAPAPAIYQPMHYPPPPVTHPAHLPATGRPANVSHRTARRGGAAGDRQPESSQRIGRPESLRRQGSQSFSRPPMAEPDDTVFNAVPPRASKGAASSSKTPTTPSKKRKRQERRESESDEEAAKVLLAISASPARPAGAATMPTERPGRTSESRDSSADKQTAGAAESAPAAYGEVPGAKDLVEEDRTPVRPYNGPSLGAHGRKATTTISGSAGGLWAASVRRKSISEQRPPPEPTDPLEPPSLRKSHPAFSSGSRHERESEPLTPGELDPPVEIVTVQRNTAAAQAPAYRDVQDPFAHRQSQTDAVLSSPLAYSKSALAAQAPNVLHQTSSLRSQTGLSTLAVAARLTTPARGSHIPVEGSVSRSNGRGGIGFGDSPAGLFGFNPFSSPSGPGELTQKLGLAPTPANVPESPGWLDVVRETPVALRAAKRQHAKKPSEGSSSENSDKERAQLHRSRPAAGEGALEDKTRV